MKRRSIVAVGTALTVLATGLIAGVAVTARSATAALSDVPADCGAITEAYRSDGQRLSYRYMGGKTSTKAISGDKLGWVPSALTSFGGAGSPDSYTEDGLAVHPTDGYVYHVYRAVKQVDGVLKVTQLTVTRVASGFAGTRGLTTAWPYVYRLADTSLYRYKFAYVDGKPSLSAPVKLSGRGWDTVRTLKHVRTDGTASAPVDVLVGTKSNGELKHWRITYASPATISSTVQKTSGWAPFTSLSPGWCNDHPKGLVLLGIKADGSASAHFDANQSDGDGSDIKGGSLGLLGWTVKAY
ncbi:hypothetical protein [Kribbella sp. NPDC003557]|uniref:hypothetical protein n=1 Tax=Kribbella sp. NPDC003557 TaxID=3154449 RepID=UPI0033B882CF